MWMREHVGRPVTTWQFAEILNVAYRKAASVQNAVSGFRKAGLWSLTIYVFQDPDFVAAMVTNIITEAAQEHNPVTCDPSWCSSSTDSHCHGDCTRAQPYATSDTMCCSSNSDSCCRGSCTKVMPTEERN